MARVPRVATEYTMARAFLAPRRVMVAGSEEEVKEEEEVVGADVMSPRKARRREA